MQAGGLPEQGRKEEGGRGYCTSAFPLSLQNKNFLLMTMPIPFMPPCRAVSWLASWHNKTLGDSALAAAAPAASSLAAAAQGGSGNSLFPLPAGGLENYKTWMGRRRLTCAFLTGNWEEGTPGKGWGEGHAFPERRREEMVCPLKCPCSKNSILSSSACSSPWS